MASLSIPDLPRQTHTTDRPPSHSKLRRPRTPEEHRLAARRERDTLPVPAEPVRGRTAKISASEIDATRPRRRDPRREDD